MPRAYIEPSALNRAADLESAPESLRDFLTRRGFEAATGSHTLYELARNFLSDAVGGPQRGQKLFNLLLDLDPAYKQSIDVLLEREVEQLRQGIEVQPFLGGQDLYAAREEVERLAGGLFDLRARQFIIDMEKQKNQELWLWECWCEDAVSFREFDQAVRRLRNFNDVWEYFSRRGDIPGLVLSILKGKVSLAEAQELAAQAPSFPAISAATRANVYLHFIMIVNCVRPGRDKLDDYKHCVEASYCEAFVTADRQQAGAMRAICPSIQVQEWNDKEIAANTGLNRTAPLRGTGT